MKTAKKPLISAIVAMAENRVIGKDNQLPWRLPADLLHFKALTTGHPILMGRKTFLSIGKPLPNRINIIMTRDKTSQIPDCLLVSSLTEALQIKNVSEAKEVFIIGGAQIYEQLLPQIERIYLTIIHQNFIGDTYFPALNADEWREIAREPHQPDEKNPYHYSFITLERK